MKFAAITVVAVLALSACDDSTMVDPGEVASTSIPENVCVNEAENQTGVAGITVSDSSYSEAGTEVKLRVPGAESTWTCIASNDGVVASLSYDGEG